MLKSLRSRGGLTFLPEEVLVEEGVEEIGGAVRAEGSEEEVRVVGVVKGNSGVRDVGEGLKG